MVFSATLDSEGYVNGAVDVRTQFNILAVSIPCQRARGEPTRCEEGKLVERICGNMYNIITRQSDIGRRTCV